MEQLQWEQLKLEQRDTWSFTQYIKALKNFAVKKLEIYNNYNMSHYSTRSYSLYIPSASRYDPQQHNLLLWISVFITILVKGSHIAVCCLLAAVRPSAASV